MEYSMGDCLVEYGFKFYEKLHEPIFLINKIGRIVKVNEAGRKLMSVTRLSVGVLEGIISKDLGELAKRNSTKKMSIKTASRALRIIARQLPNSEYLLVEIKR